jgi:hypothetical protein
MKKMIPVCVLMVPRVGHRDGTLPKHELLMLWVVVPPPMRVICMVLLIITMQMRQ